MDAVTESLSTVSFARRTERCACGTEFRHGFIFTGPAPEYKIVYVCSETCGHDQSRALNLKACA